MIVVVWGCRVCWLGCKKCERVGHAQSMKAVLMPVDVAYGVPAYPARCAKYDRVDNCLFFKDE